ncbi:hypothetical protein DMUE_2266 [Dictyocoela muelleri]|nr:hypothetical protein DMUE_2266 [Dictyocoela muelleri]
MNHNEIFFVLNRKRTNNILYNGVVYSFHSSVSDNNKRWRCVNRKCKGWLIISPEIKKIRLKSHDICEQNFKINESLYLNSNIVQRSLKTFEKPNEIIKTKIGITTALIQKEIPKYKTIRDKITRVRRKNNVTIITDDIPENIKHTFANEKFLQYDSGQEDENRIVVFSTNTHLLHLGLAEHWLCDGTFYACPRQFLQIYSIHGSIKGKNFPLFYSLMKNKSEHSYERLFR